MACVVGGCACVRYTWCPFASGREWFSGPLMSISAEGSVMLGINRNAFGSPSPGLLKTCLIALSIALMQAAPSAAAQAL